MATSESENNPGSNVACQRTKQEIVWAKLEERRLKVEEEMENTSGKVMKEIMEKLETIKVKNSKIVVETPLPKYNGERGKFHNWRDKLLSCIKCNDWKDEGRILEIIPLALTGEAKNVFQSLSKKQKSSLDLVLASLKEVLEPNYKSY